MHTSAEAARLLAALSATTRLTELDAARVLAAAAAAPAARPVPAHALAV